MELVDKYYTVGGFLEPSAVDNKSKTHLVMTKDCRRESVVFVVVATQAIPNTASVVVAFVDVAFVGVDNTENTALHHSYYHRIDASVAVAFVVAVVGVDNTEGSALQYSYFLMLPYHNIDVGEMKVDVAVVGIVVTTYHDHDYWVLDPCIFHSLFRD